MSDARDLAATGIAPRSIGAVVTSPPYVGTYDYAEHPNLSAALLGIPLGQ